MNKESLSKLAKKIQYNLTKHSPEILTGLGITGMVTTTVMAVRATPKALILIEEKKRRKDKAVTLIEKVRDTWKCYMPSTIVGVLSISCLIGASATNLKRNTALAAVYSFTESALKDYQEKVVEAIGEVKEKEIRNSIIKEKMEKSPANNSEIVITDSGNSLCYDAFAGRYFRSDVESIKKAVNQANKKMVYDLYISLNDFYDEIGLPNTKMGEELGWDSVNGLFDIEFSTILSSNNIPCITIDYIPPPKYEYDKIL